jgi:hypothetical protein
MKIQLSPSLIFLLLPALATAVADLKPSAFSSASSDLNSRYVEPESIASTNTVKGSLDAPVDGKDGRPHAGPWVETNAERDRKSNKGSDDIDLVSTKYDLKIPSSEHLGTGEGQVIPHSNGGVMDDPDRAGPKAGTRGTEGGVSEKGKDSQFNAEKQKQPDSDTTVGSGGRTADDAGTLGMLEVRSIALSIHGLCGSHS